MNIAIERLKVILGTKLTAKVRSDLTQDLSMLDQRLIRDQSAAAAGGIPQDVLKFKLAYPHPWPRPADNSRKGQIAFWSQKRTEMADLWGCESAHVEMGLDLTTSAFLRHLHQRLNFSQKLRFLQEFRDKDFLFADAVKSDDFEHPLDGVPAFQTVVHSEINPTLGSLTIEKAYNSWAAGCPNLHKRVEQPLLNLVSRLRSPPAPYNMRDALEWYGTQHDPTRSNKENILWLAACVVAGEDWRDGAFQLDEALARRVRGAMRADKKFAAAAKFVRLHGPA
jgi:hypothetical protein